MGTGALTAHLDVAQVVLYLFWIFFAGLVYYLVRENHREGYPMDTGRADGPVVTGWPIPVPKTYKLAHGGEVSIPNDKVSPQELQAEFTQGHAGSPITPLGNPMLAGVGPGAWADRSDEPDLMLDHKPKLQPLRIATQYSVSEKDPDPRGMTVYGGDGEAAGVVTDIWMDISELIFRYLEVRVEGIGRRVLLPLPFARVTRDGVYVKAVYAKHFADVPATKRDDQVTMLEEEKISAYYGAGTLYADPRRLEPLA
ncbi:MAG: photosynthetic reaction center subunit H [Rubrivivax sp.]